MPEYVYPASFLFLEFTIYSRNWKSVSNYINSPEKDESYAEIHEMIKNNVNLVGYKSKCINVNKIKTL